MFSAVTRTHVEKRVSHWTCPALPAEHDREVKIDQVRILASS